jgi:uncharacterized membrane protein YdjX (TVP38/TMEM64 family)
MSYLLNIIKVYKKEVTGVVIVTLAFLVASYFAGEYSSLIQNTVWLKGSFGIVLYLIVIIIAIVIAPISAMPLLPIAVALWGPFVASLVSILGWTIGAIFAFMLARLIGKPILSKFVDLDKVKKLENIVPQTHIFLGVVLLRMVLPVDILSYVLGLFSHMSIYSYSLATFIGIAPFAFIFAYSVELPFYFQIIIILVSVLVLFLIYLRIRSKNKINNIT